MMASEIRAKKKAEAMLFLSLALLVELQLLFAAKILVQVVLSAALALQQTLGGAGMERMWVGTNRTDVGGAEIKRMWVGFNLAESIGHYDVMLKGRGEAKNGYRWEGILSMD